MIKERNVVVAIILSIVTCGIYGLYWFVKLTDESKQIVGTTEGADGILAVILTIVTCGIYGYYWAYKLGERVDTMKVRRGEVSSSSPILFIVLQVLGLGIVNYVIAQVEINNHATSVM